MKLNEATSVTTDLKSIIATIAAVALSVWAYFSITERLNKLENADQLQQQDLLAASEQKPVDQEQFMLLEFTAKQLEKHQEQLDQNVHTGVMLKQFEKEIEKLKDAQREIKFSNGNSH